MYLSHSIIGHAIYLGIALCLVMQGVHGRLRMSLDSGDLRVRMVSRAEESQTTVKHQAAQCTSAIYSSDAKNPPPMRLSNPVLCDPEVRQRSGYVDLEDEKHVFFWYFGSRTRLAQDFNATTEHVPLVFWFSGGPGCSSQIANWQENGPCLYTPSVAYDKSMDDSKRKELPHGVERNPWAWNTVADLVFIDQPIGAGFSYGSSPNSTEGAADTAWRAMQAIHSMVNTERTTVYSEPEVKDVFIFGESYGGRYIPVFTEYLLHMNDLIKNSTDLQTRGFATLPLAGIGIGNGMFDYMIQSPTYKQMGCESTYSPSLFDTWQCKYLEKVVNPQCKKALEKCYSNNDANKSVLAMRDNSTCINLEPEHWRVSHECAYADRYCNGALNWTSYANTYDVRVDARMPPDDYVEYLQSKEFTAAVGANPDIMFAECSDAVYDRFSSTSDEISRSAMASMEYILDRNIPMLLYTGDADFICNWYGTMLVARALEWRGTRSFQGASQTPWKWPTKSGNFVDAGEYWTAENLTFLRVYQAGHEVPYYQPQASLYMLAQFLWHKQLY